MSKTASEIRYELNAKRSVRKDVQNCINTINVNISESLATLDSEITELETLLDDKLNPKG